ncbi:MAG TPA: L,D-transpeptidase [Hyphomicrobiales bacterium]|nr:L,D-transpeptidase [Hyphomicrobiales bacterium]
MTVTMRNRCNPGCRRLALAALLAAAAAYPAAQPAAARDDAAGGTRVTWSLFGSTVFGQPRQQRARIDASTYSRQLVEVETSQPPGTILIDTKRRFLYLVQDNGKAIRYGVGVGRPGFEWSGTHRISRKAEWPDWVPPAEMRRRQPYLPAHMQGGPGNPLGARALYIGSTLYRIHGTNEAQTIGAAVSSGCIRILNADVIDLYEKVDVGAKLVVF